MRIRPIDRSESGRARYAWSSLRTARWCRTRTRSVHTGEHARRPRATCIWSNWPTVVCVFVSSTCPPSNHYPCASPCSCFITSAGSTLRCRFASSPGSGCGSAACSSARSPDSSWSTYRGTICGCSTARTIIRPPPASVCSVDMPRRCLIRCHRITPCSTLSTYSPPNSRATTRTALQVAVALADSSCISCSSYTTMHNIGVSRELPRKHRLLRTSTRPPDLRCRTPLPSIHRDTRSTMAARPRPLRSPPPRTPPPLRLLNLLHRPRYCPLLLLPAPPPSPPPLPPLFLLQQHHRPPLPLPRRLPLPHRLPPRPTQLRNRIRSPPRIRTTCWTAAPVSRTRFI
mmetsp:Transcript_17905/g.53800  ORF Transcript_17905/g.53800 Transcript_17905/m.53800 type:complete len:343 (+) Transcript_17905:396-1424(+)